LVILTLGVSAGRAQEMGTEPSQTPPAAPMEEYFPTVEEVVEPEALPAEEAEPGEKTIRYTVKRGDTLWDITQFIWRDPFLWPKVWRNNIYIINPDLIYPGNVILFPADLAERMKAAEAGRPPAPMAPPAGEGPEVGPEAAPEVSPEIALAPIPEPPPPARPKPDFSLLASSGFILDDSEATGEVIGSLDDRTLLGENDTVYLVPLSKGGFGRGDRMTIYRQVRKVYHPETRKYMGYLILILGEVRITEVNEKVSVGKIENSYNYIEVGDLTFITPTTDFMGFVKDSPSSKGKPENPSDGSTQGYIVEVKEDRAANAQHDIVYLDRGLKDGLRIGDRFAITRDGEKITWRYKKPKRVIGYLEVLIARDGTATALVVQSTEVINRGDQFEPVSSP
jgi:hypothetical protein